MGDNSWQQDLGERYTGTVKNIVPGRGYTFITCPEVHALHGFDTYLHDKQREGLPVESGSTISFTIEVKNGKPQARQVQVVDTPPARQVQMVNTPGGQPVLQKAPVIKVLVKPKAEPKLIPARNKRSFDEMLSGGGSAEDGSAGGGSEGGGSTDADFLQMMLGGNADPMARMKAMEMMGTS